MDSAGFRGIPRDSAGYPGVAAVGFELGSFSYELVSQGKKTNKTNKTNKTWLMYEPAASRRTENRFMTRTFWHLSLPPRNAGVGPRRAVVWCWVGCHALMTCMSRDPIFKNRTGQRKEQARKRTKTTTKKERKEERKKEKRKKEEGGRRKTELGGLRPQDLP